MGRALPGMAMLMLGSQSDDIQLTMTNTPFCHQLIGKLPDFNSGAFQDHRFETMMVIEVAVHGRDGQIVMIMLQARQAFGQLAFVMVINIG